MSYFCIPCGKATPVNKDGCCRFCGSSEVEKRAIPSIEIPNQSSFQNDSPINTSGQAVTKSSNYTKTIIISALIILGFILLLGFF